MRAYASLSLALLALLALLACATTRVGYDFDPAADFSAYHSFGWMPRELAARQGEAPPGPSDPLLDKRIRAAVERELTARGFVKVEDATPDLYVTHDLVVEKRVESPRVSTSIGVGSWGSHGGVGISTGSGGVHQVEQGTLVIDFIDARRGGLVWRGTGTRELLRNPKPEQRTAAIDETVAKILAQYPPRPAQP
jgi:Domain of unknown function (DUF4136)